MGSGLRVPHCSGFLLINCSLQYNTHTHNTHLQTHRPHQIEREIAAAQCAGWQDSRPESERSPSPPPTYDASGARTNTRPARARAALARRRGALIAELVKICPAYRPPADYKPEKHVRKLRIPVEEHPGHNFVGLIIGPRGNTQKRLERETGARIAVRGRGSAKPGGGKGGASGASGGGGAGAGGDNDQDEDLHVLITADDEAAAERAAALVARLLSPGDAAAGAWKRAQLRELAAINGAPC